MQNTWLIIVCILASLCWYIYCIYFILIEMCVYGIVFAISIVLSAVKTSMKRASIFRFGDKIYVDANKLILAKSIGSMCLKTTNRSKKWFFLYWFPVERYNTNKSGTVNWAPFLYIVFLLFYAMKPKVDHFSGQLKWPK